MLNAGNLFVRMRILYQGYNVRWYTFVLLMLNVYVLLPESECILSAHCTYIEITIAMFNTMHF
jgi:hypothetical protein